MKDKCLILSEWIASVVLTTLILSALYSFIQTPAFILIIRMDGPIVFGLPDRSNQRARKVIGFLHTDANEPYNPEIIFKECSRCV